MVAVVVAGIARLSLSGCKEEKNQLDRVKWLVNVVK